ncbi:MAG: hypothetical protein MZV64_17890 [Ignavibacteriales bacterium]|nr:hypothetical protein [Ignavibacteriales bacterium]
MSMTMPLTTIRLFWMDATAPSRDTFSGAEVAAGMGTAVSVPDGMPDPSSFPLPNLQPFPARSPARRLSLPAGGIGREQFDPFGEDACTLGLSAHPHRRTDSGPAGRAGGCQRRERPLCRKPATRSQFGA